jgi:hypothetical protein
VSDLCEIKAKCEERVQGHRITPKVPPTVVEGGLVVVVVVVDKKCEDGGSVYRMDMENKHWECQQIRIRRTTVLEGTAGMDAREEKW